MATGHLKYDKKSDADLYRMLGEGDTADLYARKVRLDTEHDIPYAGGNSVDGKTVYIDRNFYKQIRCLKTVPRNLWVIVRGMSSDQVVQAIIEHEHTEWAVDTGDNPVDRYVAAHEYATAKEERFVKLIGVDEEYYESMLRPALERCYRTDPVRPPKDLWCGPILDDPSPRDREILRILRRLGVEDASKLSKIDVAYGIGEHECRSCTMFGPKGEKGTLRTCSLVSGLVRANRQCDRWHGIKQKEK